MSKKEKLRQAYGVSDAEMFESSKTKRGFFITDKADFIAFDADFADPYAADWLTLITGAEDIDSDETLDDELVQLTNAVEDEMENCRDKFQDSKYFIEKTFPNDPGKWNEFGYDNYEDSRRVQIKMIQFMKTFHKRAEKYKLQLIAKNYTQLMIDEIEARRKALDDANQAQEDYKGELGTETRDRYTKNNELWNVAVKVCAAGKRIYKNDYEKFQCYLLPPGEESPEAISITGLITDSVSGNPLQGTHLELVPPGVGTDTAANGRYSFGALPDGDYVVTVTLVDYVTKTVNVTITAGNAVELNVQLDHV
ncbi:MAG: carboxypeptidase-like regulatory domain-containing protein [Bacteroidia bacterium]